MEMQIRATITRCSNGSVELRPAEGDANPLGIDRIVVHINGTPNPKDFPVDSDATITINAGVRVARLDGKADVRGTDGLVPGDVVSTTDRGVRLAAAEPGAPNVTGVSAAAPAKK